MIICTLLTGSCEKDDTTTQITGGEYVVFAWNNLGMHCLNPTYDELVILPPYNTVEAQVVKRGNPPQIITTGLTVEYSLVNNTYSFGKGNMADSGQILQPCSGYTQVQTWLTRPVLCASCH